MFGNKGTLVHNQADEVFFLPQDGKPGGPEQAVEIAPTAKDYREVTDQHMQNLAAAGIKRIVFFYRQEVVIKL